MGNWKGEGTWGSPNSPSLTWVSGSKAKVLLATVAEGEHARLGIVSHTKSSLPSLGPNEQGLERCG